MILSFSVATKETNRDIDFVLKLEVYE